MANQVQTCRFLVQFGENADDLITVHDSTQSDEEIRTKWASGTIKHFQDSNNNNSSNVQRNHIRPWDFIAKPDGSVEKLLPNDTPIPTAAQQAAGGALLYPARFRIPPSTLRGLDHQEQVERAESFAMGCLLYEIYSGRKPFEKEDLEDNEVQRNFSNGVFPDDAKLLPTSLVIHAFWSQEFAKYLAKQDKIRTAIRAVRIAGIGLGVASLLAVPVLGVFGFTAVGPAAGSIAAAWQASIGLVEAGSIFAFLQSAAMGGAALVGIQAAGVAGAGIGVGALFARLVDEPEMLQTFERVYRTRDVATNSASAARI